jgi:hypothetical protein
MGRFPAGETVRETPLPGLVMTLFRPAGGCSNRQETGYRLPGAAGELDGA